MEAFNQTLPASILFVAALGFLSILKLSLAVLRWTYVSFLRPAKDLRRYGSWAVVTGATDGIGKAFAFQLAREGLHLVLVGRNPDKLRDVSDAIRARHPAVRVETVVIDFAGDDLPEGVDRLQKAVQGLDVGILVNNAGVSYPYARFFHELDEELMRRLIKVNAEGLTRVTQAVLPGMLERKRGAIVNMGSAAATVAPSDPLYDVYAATKAYIDQLSKCMHVEYKNQGIDVQCQVPLYVATKMACIRNSSFFIPSANTYARAGLRWIGYEPTCTPYWPHSLMWCFFSVMPEFIINNWRLGVCMNIRKRGQLKDAKKKGQ